ASGRIPRDVGAGLLLQAAGLAAFPQVHGFWFDEEDLRAAFWDPASGRLTLSRTPASVRAGGPGPSASAVLAGFVERLFGRSARRDGRALLERLLAPESALKRADFWVASVYREFPALAGPEAARARLSTIGYAGDFTRAPLCRARLAAARAILSGRVARIFAPQTSALEPGGALGLAAPVVGAAGAARRLRALHAAEAGEAGAVWIAVERESWDDLSRRAFDAAAHALGRAVEVVLCDGAAPPPRFPDEWRQEI